MAIEKGRILPHFLYALGVRATNSTKSHSPPSLTHGTCVISAFVLFFLWVDCSLVPVRYGTRTMVGANRSPPGQTPVRQGLRQVRKAVKHNGAVRGAAVGKKNVFVPVVRIRSPFQQRMPAHHLLVFRPCRR